MEWCANTINDRGFLKEFTQIVRTLHGVIGGIIADEKITADELKGLQDWLIDYEQFQDWWPLNQLNELIEHVLADGYAGPQKANNVLSSESTANERS